MTRAYGEPVQMSVNTAFGEPVYLGGTGVPPVETRYGYAGAWGYQAPGSSDPSNLEEDPLLDLSWLHVGERYYDPSSGRFVQRDPIGIRGGLNAYIYVENDPMGSVDPTGLLQVVANRPKSLDDMDENAYTKKYFGKGCISFNKGPVSFELSVEVEAENPYALEKGVKEVAEELNEYSDSWIDRMNRWLEKKGFGNNGDYNGPGGAGLICFVAGTEVATVDGAKPIDAIEVGDTVLTKDFENGKIIESEVVASGRTGCARELIEIAVNCEVLQSTTTHPYWTQNRGWVRAGDLVRGDVLEDIEGNGIRILSVKLIVLDAEVPVYDIKVEEQHWFYAGSARILVHNS